jgi:hypothetical protein
MTSLRDAMNDAVNTSLILPASRKTPLGQKVLIIFAMMTLMAGLLTAVMTYVNIGFSEAFLRVWRNALLSAYVIMPLGILLMALFTKLTNQLMPRVSKHGKNMVVGGLMALTMESLLAFSTAANTLGFTNYHSFFTAWLDGFLAALPVGLTLMIISSMTIKPKIENFLKS